MVVKFLVFLGGVIKTSLFLFFVVMTSSTFAAGLDCPSFDDVDADKNGVLSKAEIKNYYSSLSKEARGGLKLASFAKSCGLEPDSTKAGK